MGSLNREGRRKSSREKIIRKRKRLRAVSFACVFLGLIAAAFAVRGYLARSQTNALYETLANKNPVRPDETPAQETDPPETEPSEESELEETEIEEALPDDEYLLRAIDFAQLNEEVNEDIYAWIYIPDSTIDYPVFQHETDNVYYLNHNPDGSAGFPGCIYTEKENSRNFTDFLTLIYGHNMRDGSMFNGLLNYRDKTFFDAHPYIYIYLPDRTLKYAIYATYVYGNRHLLYAFDYDTEKGREAYLSDVLETPHTSALYRDVEVNTDSCLITLSTCLHATGPERYLVHAVLIEEYVA